MCFIDLINHHKKMKSIQWLKNDSEFSIYYKLKINNTFYLDYLWSLKDVIFELLKRIQSGWENLLQGAVKFGFLLLDLYGKNMTLKGFYINF